MTDMCNVNMDILPYVESAAIRGHLAAIGRRFNAMEAAVLIRNNESLSAGERIQAWRKLLCSSEDMALPTNDWFPEPMSLHEWLREDIRCWERARVRFEREEAGAVWLADGDRQFPSFAACAAALKTTGGYTQKVWFEAGAKARTIKAMLLPGGDYAFIDADSSGLLKPSSGMGLLSFWIDVPTPFQKGDLLKGRDGDRCILLDDERWHMTEEEHRDRETGGCFLDMCVSVTILGDRTKGHDVSPVEYPYLALDYPDDRKTAAHRGSQED